MIQVQWDSAVIEKLPTLVFWFAEIKDVHVAPSDARFDEMEAHVIASVRDRYTLETVKDDPTIRLYRDFFWHHLRIDPTKIRPAGEALLRRVLRGNQLYRINNVVDAYYLASLETLFTYAIFDRALLNPPLQIRFANPQEPFLGIGMQNPVQLKGRELVFADKNALLCVHPYRDADRSKVTSQTKNLLILTGGVPGFSSDRIKEALQVCLDYIIEMAGGTSSTLFSETTSKSIL